MKNILKDWRVKAQSRPHGSYSLTKRQLLHWDFSSTYLSFNLNINLVNIDHKLLNIDGFPLIRKNLHFPTTRLSPCKTKHANANNDVNKSNFRHFCALHSTNLALLDNISHFRILLLTYILFIANCAA